MPAVDVPGESAGSGFGSAALKVSGSIFAMISQGRLVVKLPRQRVDALVAAGTGLPFDGGKGRPMKEWLAVIADDEETRLALAREACSFAGSRSLRR